MARADSTVRAVARWVGSAVGGGKAEMWALGRMAFAKSGTLPAPEMRRTVRRVEGLLARARRDYSELFVAATREAAPPWPFVGGDIHVDAARYAAPVFEVLLGMLAPPSASQCGTVYTAALALTQNPLWRNWDAADQDGGGLWNHWPSSRQVHTAPRMWNPEAGASKKAPQTAQGGSAQTAAREDAGLRMLSHYVVHAQGQAEPQVRIDAQPGAADMSHQAARIEELWFALPRKLREDDDAWSDIGAATDAAGAHKDAPEVMLELPRPRTGLTLPYASAQSAWSPTQASIGARIVVRLPDNDKEGNFEAQLRQVATPDYRPIVYCTLDA